MVVRDMTLSDADRLEPAAGAEDVTLEMDEETFRGFYDRTARALWAYLAQTTGDRQHAEDLLQETYYRFLRTTTTFEDDDHRRNYLFRIATNLVRDQRRRPRVAAVPIDEADGAVGAGRDGAEHAARRVDLGRAMGHLKPRERSLLWLAYVQGWSHEEIASALGLKTASLKMLLFRARRRLLAALGPASNGEAR